MYCSKDCQRAHLNKHYCISKADRAPRQQSTLELNASKTSAASHDGNECTICVHPLSEASACTLPCTHVFHSTCVAQLRKYGVNEVCPLCRLPIPLGPEALYDECIRRFYLVEMLVELGHASWSALPVSAQREVDEVVTGWRAAAAEGLALAQYGLGTLFESGRGVGQDDREAARWFKKAADQGHAQAQFNLGILFKEGRGVAKSEVKAAQWYKKAAYQGVSEAQCAFESCSFNGRGMAQSDFEAAEWYKKAADQGHAFARYNLARTSVRPGTWRGAE